MRNFLLCALLSAILFFSGCAWSIGGESGKTCPCQSRKPTIVEQLEKLKKLKDAGAITDEEYQKAKKKVLDENSDKTNGQ